MNMKVWGDLWEDDDGWDMTLMLTMEEKEDENDLKEEEWDMTLSTDHGGERG